MGDGSSALVSARRYRRITARHTSFEIWKPSVAEQLEGLDVLGVERVFLIGDRPGRTVAGVRQWVTGELPAGWSHSERGHFMEGDSPVFRFEHVGGLRVELHRASAWFGDQAGRAECAEAWKLLGHLVAGAFEGAVLMATPTTTGRELWLRTIAEGREWPVLPDELQELVRSTSGQGRIELVRGPDQWPGAELPALVELDARWAYAALCRQLGSGVPVLDQLDVFEDQRRGRYRVRATVPADWCHVGILPAKDGADGWRWPARPGESFESWCDGAELLVAARAGWRFTVLERLLYPVQQAGAGPLDLWATKLAKVRAKAESLAAVGARSPEVCQLVMAGVRAMLLHAIGGFHGAPHRVTRALPVERADEAPAGAALRLEGDVVAWPEVRRPAWPEMVHPEWSSAVWARARARLLVAPGGAGALSVPFEQLVAFRTDAIYMTARPMPAWPDEGRPGQYRVKSERVGPMPAPANQAELLELREGNQ